MQIVHMNLTRSAEFLSENVFFHWKNTGRDGAKADWTFAKNVGFLVTAPYTFILRALVHGDLARKAHNAGQDVQAKKLAIRSIVELGFTFGLFYADPSIMGCAPIGFGALRTTLLFYSCFNPLVCRDVLRDLELRFNPDAKVEKKPVDSLYSWLIELGSGSLSLADAWNLHPTRSDVGADAGKEE